MTIGRAAAVECRFADTADLGDWERVRRESRQGDCVNAAWLLRAYHEDLFPLRVIECRRNGQLIGGCFGWDRRVGRVRRLQIPPTFGHGMLWVRDAGLGPSATESIVRDVALALTEFLAEHFDFIELMAAPELEAAFWFGELGWDVSLSETHRFPLHSAEEGWERLDSERRRDIRKAQKKGYAVSVSDDAAALTRAMTEMLDRRGMAHPPLALFVERAVREAHESATGRMFVCHDAAGAAAGALLALWEGKSAVLYIGASMSAHRGNGVSALMFWEAIAWLARQGRWEWVDLYGSGLMGIAVHKKQFNAPLATPLVLHLTPDPRLRMARHFRGLWSATKSWIRGKRLDR